MKRLTRSTDRQLRSSLRTSAGTLGDSNPKKRVSSKSVEKNKELPTEAIDLNQSNLPS